MQEQIRRANHLIRIISFHLYILILGFVEEHVLKLYNIAYDVHFGYFYFIFCFMACMSCSGFWMFESDIIIFFGVIFCWNFKNYELINLFPVPLLGIPRPLNPNAVLLTS